MALGKWQRNLCMSHPGSWPAPNLADASFCLVPKEGLPPRPRPTLSVERYLLSILTAPGLSMRPDNPSLTPASTEIAGRCFLLWPGLLASPASSERETWPLPHRGQVHGICTTSQGLLPLTYSSPWPGNGGCPQAGCCCGEQKGEPQPVHRRVWTLTPREASGLG